MRIARTARAEEDLIDIWTYIASDNERAADRVLDALERKTNLLASNPNIGRERFDIAAGVRSVVSGSYLILYRIHIDEVEVVRYVHARRQLTEPL
ncbi:MAG TPA: type II toxin-antitoxin system RelE/ParE family toxin [Methylocella sp.]